MAYQKQRWTNSPSTDSPINAQRLNHMEDGIGDNDERISALENEPTAHTILNKQGTAMTERPNLQFTGVAEVSDNAPSNKTIVNIPSNLSAFSNDAGFIDNTVNNLVNYYKKTETYTQAEVNALISAIVTLNILVVQTLPTQDISTTTIYLVPKATAGTNDVYDEYLYINNAWEHIGSTEVDLSNYYTQSETDALLDDKVDKVTGKQLSTEDFTSALKGKLEGIEAGAQANVQADWNQTDDTADDYIKNKPTIPSGGDSVSWTQIQQGGTKIAEIDINGTPQDVYAPQGGGGSYTEGDGINITNDEISVDTAFTEASTRANIASGDTLSTIWGKIKKFFSDLKTHAFTALDIGSLDIGGMAGGQQYVYVKGVNDFSYNNGTIQISKRTGYSSYDTELIPIPTDFVSKANGGTFNGTVTVDLQNGNADSGDAWSGILLGNNIPKGTAKHSAGYIRLYGYGSNYCEIYPTNLSAKRDFTLPDKSGTIALTSDIPDISTKVSKSGDTMSGNLLISGAGEKYFRAMNTDTGCAIYLDSDVGGNHGIWTNGYYNGSQFVSSGKWALYRNTSGTVILNGNATADESGNNIKSSYASRMRLTAEGANRLRYELYAKDGSALTSDTVQLNTSSRKYKENIEPLTEDEARKILDIETVIFDYKKDHENYTSRKGYKNIGCIAEDVNKIIPEVVTEDNGEIYGINYTEMIPYLIKMIQIQQKEIDELKAIIKANE
jgi:hypothetical protein